MQIFVHIYGVGGPVIATVFTDPFPSKTMIVYFSSKIARTVRLISPITRAEIIVRSFLLIKN